MSSVTVYSDMTPDVASAARAAAERIRVNLNFALSSIASVGYDLNEMKEKLPHGQFIPWIDAEFGMSRFTADRYMNVAKTLGDKCSSLQHLPKTVLYALAAPSTPEVVRDEAVELAKAGEPVDLDVVAKLKEKLKASKGEIKEAKDNAEVAAAQARQLMHMSAEADNELLFLRSQLRQQAEEIERLKQDNVIHVYADAEPAQADASKVVRPSFAAINTHAARAAEMVLTSMNRDEISEFIGLLLLTTSEQIAEHVRGLRDEEAA